MQNLKSKLQEWQSCDSIFGKERIKKELTALIVPRMRELYNIYKEYFSTYTNAHEDPRYDALCEFNSWPWEDDVEMLERESGVGKYHEGPSTFRVKIAELTQDNEELRKKLKADGIAWATQQIKDYENKVFFYKERLAKLQETP